MTKAFEMHIDGWKNGERMPDKFAFGIPDKSNHVEFGNNLSPSIQWNEPPAGTKSFAIVCVDVDVPSIGDDVNKEGRLIPFDLPRTDFYHWLLVDIPANVSGLTEGVDSVAVTPGGKKTGKADAGVRGVNDYTSWFVGDTEMEGTYGGYDGPCPPWNDTIIHHYHFNIFALDIPSLELSGNFVGAQAMQAIKSHVLGRSLWVGTYTLNPDLR